MQVNSQLLDTVQHKARLGEQLDEMEVNIVSQIQARRIKKQEKTFIALKVQGLSRLLDAEKVL